MCDEWIDPETMPIVMMRMIESPLVAAASGAAVDTSAAAAAAE